MLAKRPIPIVLCFGGHDPSGGAGIQADIEAIAAGQCHATPIVTALTEQDTQQVYSYQAVHAESLFGQASRVLADMNPAVIKVGMVASQENLQVIVELSTQNKHLPLVVDPVLAATVGGSLSDESMAHGLLKELIPMATVITPNTEELAKLTGKSDQQEAVATLLATGCKAVLVTGTHADTPDVTNTLYRPNQPPLAQEWPRLPYSYHGSGCTLASAIAAGLARGNGLEQAVITAQTYTWNSLERASRPGKGQWLPGRLIS